MTPLELPTGLSFSQFAGFSPGPRFIILGAVHGNEICGTQAILRIRNEIESGVLRITKGMLTLIPVTNPLAFALKRRMGDRNLNRHMRITEIPEDFEDLVSNQLCPLLKQHDVLLDIHSFHSPGRPFALIGPSNNADTLEPFSLAEQEGAFALSLGVNRFVEGWLDTYARGVLERQARGVEGHSDYGVGTTETIRRVGGIGVTLECGQHDDPQASVVAYRAIRGALEHLGMASGEKTERPMNIEVIRLYKVIDRLHSEDRFDHDWRSFQKIKQGELLALRQNGAKIFAQADGWIVFPNRNAQVDEEWFYLAEASGRLAEFRARLSNLHGA